MFLQGKYLFLFFRINLFFNFSWFFFSSKCYKIKNQNRWRTIPLSQFSLRWCPSECEKAIWSTLRVSGTLMRTSVRADHVGAIMSILVRSASIRHNLIIGSNSRVRLSIAVIYRLGRTFVIVWWVPRPGLATGQWGAPGGSRGSVGAQGETLWSIPRSTAGVPTKQL